MTRKTKRIMLVMSTLVIVCIAISVLLSALNNNVMFFKTPTELKEKENNYNKNIRLGGLVKKNTIKHNNTVTEFVLTDCKNDVIVLYEGILPNLFREGQGIIATGKFDGNILYAKELLTKHDEKYIPKELYKAKIQPDMCQVNP